MENKERTQKHLSPAVRSILKKIVTGSFIMLMLAVVSFMILLLLMLTM